MPAMQKLAVALAAALASVVVAQNPSSPDADAFAQGYAAAVLERDLRLNAASVSVVDGVLTLRAPNLGGFEAALVREVLARIVGVRRVDIVLAAGPDEVPGATVTHIEPRAASLLSRTPLLFEAPIADPRWPHFSAAYQAHEGSEFGSLAAVSFGESFSFYRAPFGREAEWELGCQAGVFAIFDLDSESFDLVNADYTIGPVATVRSGPLSLLGRLHHQSSHLGDEYLLRTARPRINLSYEVLDLLASWKPSESVRVYGGGGYVVHSDTDLDPWSVQGGVDYIDATSAAVLRPVFGVDVQARESSDWNVDVSVRLGVQLQDTDAPRGRVQLLLEYYNGRSPNGQFAVDEVEWFGVGAHFYF